MTEKEQLELLYPELKQKLLDQINLSKTMGDIEILTCIDKIILERSNYSYISLSSKNKLRKELFYSIRGLDILQELIDDCSITEIMVNGATDIFIEKQGILLRCEKKFESKQKLEDIVQQIVSSANRIVNEANPIVDARLQDGSRVNIVLPPIALNGPIVTIRKFPEKPIGLEELVQLGAITDEAAEFLKQLVRARYNIFISGGTGSGKTTFLNALSGFIPLDERIITIEDSAELQIQNIPNLVRLEVRNKNVEGKHAITIRDLIKTALRMRPDRIVVGEVRDGAALDMIHCMNTGHDGSLSTGHANSPIDMLSRLETLVLMGADLPLIAIQKQIASAIDIIVHLGRLRDKSRKVLDIIEVLDCVEGEIGINPLYSFVEQGDDKEGKVVGKLEKTNNPLVQVLKLKRAGLVI